MPEDNHNLLHKGRPWAAHLRGREVDDDCKS